MVYILRPHIREFARENALMLVFMSVLFVITWALILVSAILHTLNVH